MCAVSDAFPLALFARALTGAEAAGTPLGGFRDTGAYVVTGFINLAEQRRTCGGFACARAMMSSCAHFGGLVLYAAGRLPPAQRAPASRQHYIFLAL